MPKQYHRFPGNDAHNFYNNNKHKNIMPLLYTLYLWNGTDKKALAPK